MAVRWGPGEESFSTCNMDIFPLETLDETHGLCSEHTLGTFQDCLDPTILSIFEDTPATKTRDLEEETEATLLTALTEILDNVDDENLSPFDMLPESDLLSGQKGREQSPLRRIFGLSRSPPGKIRSTGKTLPMVQQRSDGEEDEDCLTQSPESLDLSSDNELLDWDGLPITLGEQHDEDGLSVNLGDLVKHMHPYCMSFSLEDDKGNQMLPEGGILLEVVDQGENGEPILAIPEMVHPVSVKLDELLSDSKGLEKTDDQASDTSEHIVVDDDDDVDVNIKLPVRDDGKITSSDVRSQITKDDNKGDLKGNNNSRQKNKSNLVVASTPQPTGGRVLRSASLKKASRKQPKKCRNEGGQKDSKAPQDLNTMSTIEPKNTTISQTEICTVSLLPVFSKQAEEDQPETPPKAECFQQPDPILNIVAPASANEESAIATSTDDPCASVNEDASPKLTHATDCTGELPSSLLPPAVMVEPKPKALSLAEYRRLRQQKKPAPIEKLDNNSTKWPSLPEMPKELPPLPHLPEPSPRDPRRSKLQSKEPEEVKPAWMPRGPGAPPTPEALLAPPAYMVNSTVKASTTAVPTKQQTVSQTVPFQPSNCENISAAAPHTQETTKREGYSATDSPETVSADALKPAANVLTCKPSNAAVSPEIKPSIKSSEELPKSTDSCGQKFSSSVSQSPEKSEKPPVKNPTEELIEAFTSEMGIEATDLTSLLEQFEETQAKEEQCVPEVCGRAVAVGNSSSDLNSERNYVERVRANDLSSTALTPPGTPPHPTWKPLVPVALLGKSKTEEIKSGLSKIIEIEAQPLPSVKARSKYTPAAVTPDMACQDHDYCLPNKGTSSGEAGKRWNVKQNSSIFIKPIKQSITPAQQNVQTIIVKSVPCAPKTQLDLQTDCLKSSSVFETPDASPTRDAESNNFKQAPVGQSNCQSASSPTPSLKQRSEGRSRVRRSRRSPSSRSNSESDSSRSRSRSYTPPTKRYRLHRSRSSSFSRSRSRSSSASESPSRSPRCRRYSYFSSRSASWSRSRSRSRSCSRSRSRSRSKSPQWSRKRQWCRDSYGTNVKTNHELKIQKEKAIEERRVVYVGRIRGTMTQKELKERFSYFGKIEECTLHFRDHGDHYGFVTYYNTNDAFMAIENGSKLRKPDEYPFDLCFGGRRQFCQTSYADLDSSKEYDPLPSRSKTLALDFDTLLKQAQQNMKR